MNKKIKIFDYAWHIPHQYDMMYALREDCEFYYCLNTKRQWDTSVRPVPENLRFVTHYEEGKYDLAILHIDQQTISFDHLKQLIYKQFNSIITDIPRIVLNHGSPVFPERFYEMGYKLSETEMRQRCIVMIKKLVGDHVMVVNSHTAASEKEWGFGIPIVHGINPADWWDLPKEPRVFTALSSVGFDTYYNRRCMIKVSDRLHDEYGYILGYANLNIDTSGSPEDYKDYLGRSLLYLDTSFRTPMNRARTEAFLSGCCVIQVEGAHDLEHWARHGENIILVPDNPDEIAALVANILENRYEEAIAIGQKGKQMAIEQFSPERYKRDWLSLIERILKEKQSPASKEHAHEQYQ
jgi:glycosyltransferase involved in cell wall biosynthesis